MKFQKKQIIFLVLAVILTMSILPNILLAATGGDKFVPLAPFPRLAPPPTGDTFADFITNVFYINLAIGGVLAVIYMMIGGLQYMTTDAMGGKEEGRERITKSLVGLLLLISGWLILSTINPQLISNSLNLDPIPPPDLTSNKEDKPPPPDFNDELEKRNQGEWFLVIRKKTHYESQNKCELPWIKPPAMRGPLTREECAAMKDRFAIPSIENVPPLCPVYSCEEGRRKKRE